LLEEGIASVPISLQLGGIHSGKFSGNLLVTYRGEDEKRGSLKVPVTVNLKDGPWGPVIVLLIGVLLGAGLSHYRAKGKKGDEVRMQYDNLAETRDGDEIYTSLDRRLFFRAGIDRDMAKTVDRLAIHDVDGAETGIKNAWATWDHWYEYKERLPIQIQRLRDLQKELATMEADLRERETEIGKFQYLPESRRALTGLFTMLQRPVDFKEFQDAFGKFEAGLTTQETSFDNFEDVVHLLKMHEPKNEEGRDTEKGKKIAEYWVRLTGITQDQDISGLEKIINSEFPTMTFKKKKTRHHEVKKEEPDWWNRFGRNWGLRFSWAAIRLGIFGVLTFALLVIVLVITGYKELYLANATFGVGAGDYFAIFLWGLGTAPGSEAAVKAVRDQFGG